MFLSKIINTFVKDKKNINMKNEKSFCIIKKVVQANGKTLNVLMLDVNTEVLEFDNLLDAEKFATLLTQNSDSGWEYIVKEI